MEQRNNKNLIIGSIVILLGLLFLGAEFNFIGFDLYQAIFVNHLWLVGLGAFIALKNRPNVIFGFAFIILGVLFFSSDMGYIGYVYWNNAWPIFLIAAGLNAIIGKKISLRRGDRNTNSTLTA